MTINIYIYIYVQILDEAVYILLRANSLGKSKSSFILSISHG